MDKYSKELTFKIAWFLMIIDEQNVLGIHEQLQMTGEAHYNYYV